MKTNSEKAKELALACQQEGNGHIERIIREDALIEMAEFVTDRACEWLLCHAYFYGYADADLGNAEYHYDAELMIKALRKAMEE